MGSDAQRFAVFVLASLIVFIAILRFVARRRPNRPATASVIAVAGIVIVGGMVVATFAANSGLSWWIYYSASALATLILPPFAFAFSRKELAEYLILAFLSSPVIHVAFSFLLGWHEYMPFIPVPSLQELLAQPPAGA